MERGTKLRLFTYTVKQICVGSHTPGKPERLKTVGHREGGFLDLCHSECDCLRVSPDARIEIEILFENENPGRK